MSELESGFAILPTSGADSPQNGRRSVPRTRQA